MTDPDYGSEHIPPELLQLRRLAMSRDPIRRIPGSCMTHMQDVTETVMQHVSRAESELVCLDAQDYASESVSEVIERAKLALFQAKLNLVTVTAMLNMLNSD